MRFSRASLAARALVNFTKLGPSYLAVASVVVLPDILRVLAWFRIEPVSRQRCFVTGDHPGPNVSERPVRDVPAAVRAPFGLITC